jgi:8-oxo-dGTP pyrophosphatase MutT (NUDIX family)
MDSIQLYADEFVESAGAIIFHLPSQRICIVYNSLKKEYLLPKGRRNCAESRINAALREVQEETGYKVKLLPITMSTRTPPADEQEFTPDVPRFQEHACDPFALTIREEGKRQRKLIWWYIAQVDSVDVREKQSHLDKELEPVWMSFDEVGEKLSYIGDRELVGRAIEIVRRSIDL